METRDSFRGIQSDYYTHVHDLPPQVGGCQFSGDHDRFTDEIDGKGKSWRLPLSEAGGVEPVRACDRDQTVARIGAARALIKNHKAVVPFAARVLGDGGWGVRAPKSDPNRKREPRAEPYVDVALRIVAELMMKHNGDHQAVTDDAMAKVSEANLPAGVTIKCLNYFNDRIGVPRDMNFAEARQLRAHVNAVVDALT